MKNAKIISIGLIAAGIILGFSQTRLFHRPPLPSLTIAEANNPAYSLVYIADKKGYFREEDLDVHLQKHSLGSEAVQDVLDGKADVATTFEVPVVRRTYEGAPIRVLTMLHHASNNTGLVVRKDRGVTTAADLQGKRIGVTKGAHPEGFLYSFLATQNLKISDINIVNAYPEEMARLLESGMVDAVATYNPYLSAIRNGPLRDKIDVLESDIYTESSVLVCREDFLKHNPEEVDRLLRALMRAEELARANRGEAITLTSQSLSNVSEDTVRQTWAIFNPRLGLDNSLMLTLTREARWYRELNIYNTPLPNFRQVIATDPLRTIAPESVTIL